MAHHGGTADLDWSAMLDALARADEIEADVTAQIAGWLLTGPERVIYDVGCGAGGMTAALSAAAPDARLVAVDGEPALLAATRRHTGVETVLADLGTELPIPPASADLIWASGVLHHLPDQQSVVTDLATGLRQADGWHWARAGCRAAACRGIWGSASLAWRSAWTPPTTGGSPGCAATWVELCRWPTAGPPPCATLDWSTSPPDRS